MDDHLLLRRDLMVLRWSLRCAVVAPFVIKQATTCLLNCRNSYSRMVTRRIQAQKAHSSRAALLSQPRIVNLVICGKRKFADVWRTTATSPLVVAAPRVRSHPDEQERPWQNAGFVELLPRRFQSNVGYPAR
ncbi:hypothetical protein B296_00051750 [Ensete ventricosum]|uniref:Uncharacterized protein n=1 Tax=Ensete ventricosum TaxID=4639 RepID=A0A426X8P8_ENSVE|nr:hypothetical protein B296_00051750 [Ensete ventricosum]